MPAANVYYVDDQYREQLHSITKDLKEFIANELTCGDIQLQSHEVSIRLLKAEGDGMLAAIELEMTAHAFEDRVKKQYKICLNVRRFLKDKIDVPEVRVWLILSELGHSWEQ